MLEPETADGVGALVRDGSCELGAAHLPLPRQALIAHPLGQQELLFVLPPGAPAAGERPLGARELTPPLRGQPARHLDAILLEQALASSTSPRRSRSRPRRGAIVPLVLAGAGAALLPAPLAREARRRGANVRAARPRSPARSA